MGGGGREGARASERERAKERAAGSDDDYIKKGRKRVKREGNQRSTS